MTEEMDGDLVELLGSWKINQLYIQRLADQEIYSIETLLHLTDEDVKQIFNTVGSYIGFTKYFEKFKTQWFQHIMSVEELETISIIILVEDLVRKVAALGSDDGKDSSETQSSSNSTNAKESEDLTLDERADSTASSNMNQEDSTGRDTNGSSSEKLTVESSRKRKFSFDNDMDLKKLLESTVNGKMVLTYYRTSNDLSEFMRNALADVILNEHLKDDYDRKLSYETEVSMAEKICELFPSECKEIWASSTPGARQSSGGRAKLLSRYYQKRRILRKGKLLSKDKSTDHDTSNLSSDDDDPNDERYDDVLWLKNNKQPWSKVEELWKSTSRYRMRKLKGKEMPTGPYMATYPALRDPVGHLLLEMDFDLEFPNSRVNLFAEWPTLSAFIESKLKIPELEAVQSCLTSDGKKIKTIWSLPYLFPVTTCAKKGRKKQWRPSRLEVAEALLLHVKCVGDIEPTLINRLKEKYEPYSMSLFPQAIIVGADVDSIQLCYIRVNNILYQVDNPRKAIDITFKIFHALDVKYHAEAEREWLFLERAVYGVNTNKPGDSKIKSVVKDYLQFKNNV